MCHSPSAVLSFACSILPCSIAACSSCSSLSPLPCARQIREINQHRVSFFHTAIHRRADSQGSSHHRWSHPDWSEIPRPVSHQHPVSRRITQRTLMRFSTNVYVICPLIPACSINHLPVSHRIHRPNHRLSCLKPMHKRLESPMLCQFNLRPELLHRIAQGIHLRLPYLRRSIRQPIEIRLINHIILIEVKMLDTTQGQHDSCPCAYSSAANDMHHPRRRHQLLLPVIHLCHLTLHVSSPVSRFSAGGRAAIASALSACKERVRYVSSHRLIPSGSIFTISGIQALTSAVSRDARLITDMVLDICRVNILSASGLDISGILSPIFMQADDPLI